MVSKIRGIIQRHDMGLGCSALETQECKSRHQVYSNLCQPSDNKVNNSICTVKFLLNLRIKEGHYKLEFVWIDLRCEYTIVVKHIHAN